MARNAMKRTQNNALIADYLVEMALAGQQVFAKGCRAIKLSTEPSDPGFAAYYTFTTCSMEGGLALPLSTS
jgi:hypothetical protein